MNHAHFTDVYKAVPLLDSIKFESFGQVISNGICCGDVDNDGNYELCVGNSEGVVNVFKGTEHWRQITDAGHVVAMTIGDLFNTGENVLVIISAEGCLTVYKFSPEFEESLPNHRKKFEYDSDYSPTPSEIEWVEEGKIPIKMKRCFDQQLPPNVKTAEIIDVDDDGKNELLVTLTDRVVRTYQWSGFEEVIESEEEEKVDKENPKETQPEDENVIPSIEQLKISDDANEEEQEDENNQSVNEEVVQEVEDEAEIENNDEEGESESVVESSPKSKVNDSIEMRGELISMKKWEFGGQVGGTSVGWRENKKPIVYVTQPEGTYHKIILEENCDLNTAVVTSHVLENVMGTPDLPPEIVARLKDEDGEENGVAFISSDGVIVLQNGDQVRWVKMLETALMWLYKLDVTLDGMDEMVFSSWGGTTYIITQTGDIYVFPFDTEISAFSCGLYTIDGKTVPVLIFVTYNELIHVFHNISEVTKCIYRQLSYSSKGKTYSPNEISKLVYKR